MSRRGRRSMVIAGLAVLLAARPVRAQSGGSAEAAELFQQGRSALDAKDYAAACRKFIASLQLEPAVGTLISLAECEEARNQLASARQHWHEAADLADARNDVLHRGAFARQKFAALDARVPRLLVRLAAGAPRETVFRRDDVALDTASLDIELPVDPGLHVVAVTAKGRETKTYKVELVEGEHKSLEVEPGPQVVTPTAASSSEEGILPASRPILPEATARSSSARSLAPAQFEHVALISQRSAAYVVGGIGLVGIGIGTYFGINAFSEWSTANNLCPCAENTSQRTDATTHKANAEASGRASTVAFVSGAAVVAGAAVLWALAPADRADRVAHPVLVPEVDARGVGLIMNGTW